MRTGVTEDREQLLARGRDGRTRPQSTDHIQGSLPIPHTQHVGLHVHGKPEGWNCASRRKPEPRRHHTDDREWRSAQHHRVADHVRITAKMSSPETVRQNTHRSRTWRPVGRREVATDRGRDAEKSQEVGRDISGLNDLRGVTLDERDGSRSVEPRHRVEQCRPVAPRGKHPVRTEPDLTWLNQHE